MTDQEKKERKKDALGSLGVLAGHWKDGSIREIREDWKWIFSYTRGHSKQIIWYTLIGLLSSTMGVISSVAGKYVIDIITGYKREQLWILIVVTVGSALINMTLGNLLNRLSFKLSLGIYNEIQRDVFNHLMDADWMSLNGYSGGDILNRFQADVRMVAGNAVSWIPNLIIAVYSFILTFAVLLRYNLVMALLTLLSAVLSLLMGRFVIGRQRKYARDTRKMSSEIMAFEVETFSNMDTIKSFGIGDLYENKLVNWQKKNTGLQSEYNLFTIKTGVGMNLIRLLVQYAAFGYCLWLLWNHAITYGTMTLFLGQRSSLQNSFQTIIGMVPNFLNSSVCARRIRELMDLPKEKDQQLSDELIKEAQEGISVRMEHVDFSYVSGTPVILDSDFIARQGEIVALAGPSGEGKTTMIRLILGLTHPDSGKVVLADVKGNEVAPGYATRRLCSYVPQGNTILSGTIADNLRMVAPEASDEQLIQALQSACAWDFVREMSDGLYHNIGERGKGLSEGQAQRIAIARALLRDAPVLLLDEATSALDVGTERAVLRNIMRYNPRRTCILTTHRPSVLQMCERVYRVKNGHVVELDEQQRQELGETF